MLELAVRVVLSLGVVLGLFWFVARAGSRRMGGHRDRALLRVRGRQSLSRTSSLAVVEVGSRILVLGVSDGGVRLLTEMHPDELDTDGAAPVVEAVAVVVAEGDDEREDETFASAYDAAYAAARSGRLAEPGPAPAEPTPVLAEPAQALAEQAPAPLPTPSAAGRGTEGSGNALRGSLLDGAVWRGAWSSATGRGSRDEDAA